MKPKMKKSIIIAVMTIILSMSCVMPAYANSAPSHWRGVNSVGAIVIEENCPIEVKREVLTFDISEFPMDYYNNKSDYLAYSGKVTAEYTFYNPTDYIITSTLVFPFGMQPTYAAIYDEEVQSYIFDIDIEKYDIMVNGEAIDKKIRYTHNMENQFELSRELAKISDNYISDDFYSPNMTVTKYTYIVGGIDKEGLIDKAKYNAANAAFDWDGGNGDTKIYVPEDHQCHIQNDGDLRIGRWADNGDIFSIYAIGQPLSTPLDMKCYNGKADDGNEISGTVSLAESETMTFEAFALENWDENTGVSKIDWYNAVMSQINELNNNNFNAEYNYLYLNMPEKEFMSRYFMRWYEYEITIAPNESIVNSVTAPMYPSIDQNYTPNIYAFTYLLSPASAWAEFGELEIVINTPFFITESSIDGFTKTENGYKLIREGLPGGELEFKLCASDKPRKVLTPLLNYILFFGAISLYCCGGILFIGGGIIAFIIIRKKRKKKSMTKI